MDKTILEIISLLISFTGLLGAIKNIHKVTFRTYWGENIGALKFAEIDKCINNNLLVYTGFGIIIQLLIVIFEDLLIIRLYSWQVYLMVLIISTIVVYFTYLGIIKISNYHVMKKWFPKHFETIKSSIDVVQIMIDSDYSNDGTRTYTDIAEQERNKKNVINKLETIKDWLDIASVSSEPDKILSLIKIKFNKYSKKYL